MENTHKSQKYFFDAITPNKLNELFHRADAFDGELSVLSEHINAHLKEPLKSMSTVNVNKHKSYCDIIIFFNDNLSEIGHFTLHCKTDDTSMNHTVRKCGRIHLKQKL